MFLDQPVNVIHASAAAFGALDTEHVELGLDVTEDEIVAGHCATVPSPARRALTLLLAEIELRDGGSCGVLPRP